MRMALGAPRSRLIAYMLAESGIIAVDRRRARRRDRVRLHPLVAVAAARRSCRGSTPSTVDLPVLIFALAIAALAAILAGLGPALIATRTDAVLAMRAAARNIAGASSRVRATLVVVEIAASIVLLVGAALLARSLTALIDTDLGRQYRERDDGADRSGDRAARSGDRQVEIARGAARADRRHALGAQRSVSAAACRPTANTSA